MHELYMWPFADTVHAGTASISESAALKIAEKGTNTISVLVHPREQLLRLPKQRAPQWSAQDRAGLRRLRRDRLGCSTRWCCLITLGVGHGDALWRSILGWQPYAGRP